MWTEPLVSGQHRLLLGGILLRVIRRRPPGRLTAPSGSTYPMIAASRLSEIGKHAAGRWQFLRHMTVHSRGANRCSCAPSPRGGLVLSNFGQLCAFLGKKEWLSWWNAHAG